MQIKKFLKITENRVTFCRPQLTCNDGFKMSIQASEGHYCNPRENSLGDKYDAVEIGFPSEYEAALTEFDDGTGRVFGWVDIDVVEHIIEKHGGINWMELANDYSTELRAFDKQYKFKLKL